MSMALKGVYAHDDSDPYEQDRLDDDGNVCTCHPDECYCTPEE